MLVAAILACCLALFVGLFADRIGERLRVVDRPDGQRKLHKRATPLVGGFAVVPPVVAGLEFTQGNFLCDPQRCLLPRKQRLKKAAAPTKGIKAFEGLSRLQAQPRCVSSPAGTWLRRSE